MNKRSMPVVTIITPSLNQGRFIEETILSVLNQDYPHIEYIVVDGSSTDNTIDILRKYDKRLTWTSEPDNGQADAINKGIRKSSGSIIGWLNADDTYCGNAIATAVDYLQANPDADWIYGDGYQVDEKGDTLRKFPYTQEFNLWRLINVSDYILQPTVFMRREPLFAVGLIDTRLNWCFDWDLWIRLARRREGRYVPAFFAQARCHRTTKTATGGLKRLREIFATMHRHGGGRYPIGFLIHFAAACELYAQHNYPRIHRVFLEEPLSVLKLLYRKVARRISANRNV